MLKTIKTIIFTMLTFGVGLFLAYILIPIHVEMYNNSFLIIDTYLDLSKIKIDDINELVNKLGSFSEVKTVDLGYNYLTIADKNALVELYPDIDFKVIVKYEIYGKEYLDNITELDFSDSNIDDSLSEYIGLFSNLNSVNLMGKNLELEAQKVLSDKFPHIDFKWEVNIVDIFVSSDVTALDLSNMVIQDKNEFYVALSLLKHLQNLDMSYTNLTNEELGQLREDFPKLNINWVLKLGHNWQLRTDDIAFSVLIKSYPYIPLKSEDLEVFKYCTQLQALDLGHQRISDVTAIGNYLPELRILILADNRIKDISPLKNLKHLHYIELFMNDITDASPLSELDELVDVNISYNPHFSDITPLLNFSALERLWLVADKISKNDYELIKETYPDVKLVNTGRGSTDSGWRTHARYHAMIDMFNKRNYMSEEFLKYDK